MSGFLNWTNSSILMKTESLKNGQKEISGAIVRRQQGKVAEKKEDEVDLDEGSQKKKKKTATKSKKEKKEPAVSRTPADEAKDTAEKFEYILRKGIEDAKAQNPGKVVVILVDGGGPHTTEPFVSLRPNKMSSAEREAELREAGLWPNPPPNSVAEAKRIYTASPIPLKQWTNAELIALELGAVVVYIPLHHPHLNVIEQVWRAVKQHYRLHCGEKNVKNMLQFAHDALTGGKGAEHVCSKEAIERRKKRTRQISEHLAANPTGDPLRENQLRGKNFVPWPDVDVSKVPKFGSLKVPKNLRHLGFYAHYLNQARIKQFKKKTVGSCLRFSINAHFVASTQTWPSNLRLT